MERKIELLERVRFKDILDISAHSSCEFIQLCCVFMNPPASLLQEVADLRDALATAEQREREACRRVFDQSLRQVRDQAAEERERVRQEHEAERKREQQVTKKRIAQVQQQVTIIDIPP